jgi:hypothetical protein
MIYGTKSFLILILDSLNSCCPKSHVYVFVRNSRVLNFKSQTTRKLQETEKGKQTQWVLLFPVLELSGKER